MLTGALGIGLGAVLALIGQTVYNQMSPHRDFLPALSYSLWWYSAGTFMTLQGVVVLADYFWRPQFAIHLTEAYVNLLVGSLALFCLSHYFAHLFLGPTKIWVFLAGFYGLSVLTLFFLISHQRPIGLEIVQANVSIVYANRLPAFGLVERLISLFFIPPLIGTIGYLSLYRRAPLKVQRYRILLVCSIVLLVAFFAATTRPFAFHFPLLITAVVLLSGIVLGVLLLFTYHRIPGNNHHGEASPS